MAYEGKPEVLSIRTLTSVVKEIDLADEFLSQQFDFLFPTKEVRGDHATFRTIKTKLDTNEFMGRNAQSKSRGLTGLSEHKVVMPYQKSSFFIPQNDVINLTKKDSLDERDVKQWLAEEMEESRRMMDRTREMLIWKALRWDWSVGSGLEHGQSAYKIPVDGKAEVIDDSNFASAADTQSGQAHYKDVSANGANEPWSTPTTNILQHLADWKKLILQDSGRTPTHVFCSSKTFNYILQNEDIQTTVGGTNYAVNLIRGEKTEEIGQAMHQYGPIQGLLFVVWDASFTDSLDGTTKQFIPDDVIIMTPSSTDWSEFQVGEVGAVGEDGQPTVLQAPASYSETVADPPGTRVYSVDAALPVVKLPTAILTAKVA